MMTIQTMRVTCQKCQTVQDAEYVANCPVAVSTASMKAMRCVNCGSDKLGMGGHYQNKPPVSLQIEYRIMWWGDRGERGISSDTIFHAFGAGALSRNHHDIPHDPDDFKRCRQLLDLLPEWRATLDVVSKKYPYWKPFIDRWDEMDKLYDEEFPTGKAPKLYALMQVAEEEARKIRGWQP